MGGRSLQEFHSFVFHLLHGEIIMSRRNNALEEGRGKEKKERKLKEERRREERNKRKEEMNKKKDER